MTGTQLRVNVAIPVSCTRAKTHREKYRIHIGQWKLSMGPYIRIALAKLLKKQVIGHCITCWITTIIIIRTFAPQVMVCFLVIHSMS